MENLPVYAGSTGTDRAQIADSHPDGERARAAGKHERGHIRAAASIALALVVAGSGATAFAMQSQHGTASPAATQALAPSGDASYLPASTLLYISYNPKIGGPQGTYLRQIQQIFTSQPGFAAAVAETTGQKSASCIDLNKQVLSWVNGSITLAITDPKALSSTSSSAMTQGISALIAVTPGSTISGVLARNKLGTAKMVSSYSGVPYYDVQITACNTKPDKTPTYVAVVKNEAIIAPSLKDLQKEIDVIQGKAASLSTTTSYKRIIAALPPTGVGYVYIDTPALIKAGSGPALSTLGSSGVNPLGGSSTTKTNPSSTDSVAKQFGPSGVSLLAQADGIRIQTAVLLNTPSKQPLNSITPNKGATMLPAGSIFYLSVGNLQGVVNAALDAVTTASTSNAQTINQLKVVFGNVLNLLDGEFALGIMPITAKDAVSLANGDISGLPLAALFDVSKHADAGVTISTLLSALGGTTPELKFTTAKSSHGTTEYVNKAGYGYAILKGWAVVSTSIKNAITTLENVAGGKQPSLASDKAYQTAGQALAKHASGTMFLDITQLRATLESFMLSTAGAADKAQYLKIRPLLVPMKAIEASSSVENKGTVARFDALLLISK